MNTPETGTTRTNKKQRRYTPYTRTPRHKHSTPLSKRSVADYMLDFCYRLGRPLISNGSPFTHHDDVFNVPWRSIDRESESYREEFYRNAENSTDLEHSDQGSVASDSDTSDREENNNINKAQPPAPQYESLFETARILGDISSSTKNPSYKGKEAEVASSNSGESEHASEGLGIAGDFDGSSGDEDEEDDEDFEPNHVSTDDDEEEVLQEDIEPIDSNEEVVALGYSQDEGTHIDDSHAEETEPSSAAEPEINIPVADDSEQIEYLSGEDDGEDEESIAVDSVDEALDVAPGSEPASEDNPAINEESGEDINSNLYVAESGEGEPEQALHDDGSAESLSEEEEEEEEKEEEEEDDDESNEEVKVGFVIEEEAIEENDDVEENRANDSAEDHNTQETEDNEEPEQQQSTLASSKSWWPFSRRSLFGAHGQENKEPKQKREEYEVEAVEHEQNPTPKKHKTINSLCKSATSESEHRAVAVGVQTPSEFEAPLRYERRRSNYPATRVNTGKTPLPYSPRSFIKITKDTTASVNKRKRTEDNNLALKQLPHKQQQPEPGTPQNTELKRQRTTPSTVVSKPPITPASLGLAARRSAVRGIRRKTSIYYGAGYGSKSIPYMFRTSRSAPSPGAAKTPTANRSHDSSSTAKQILNIIEDAPPVRSQAYLESCDVINPYELDSPYSVRMRPKQTVYKRRTLAPVRPLSSSMLEESRADQGSRVPYGETMSATEKILMNLQKAAPQKIRDRLEAAAVEKNKTDKQKPVEESAKDQEPEPAPLFTEPLPSSSVLDQPPKERTVAACSAGPSTSASVSLSESHVASKQTTNGTSTQFGVSDTFTSKPFSFNFGVPKTKPVEVENAAKPAEPESSLSVFKPSTTANDAPTTVVLSSTEEKKAQKTESVTESTDLPKSKPLFGFTSPMNLTKAPSTIANKKIESELPKFQFIFSANSNSTKSSAAMLEAKSASVSKLPVFSFSVDVESSAVKSGNDLWAQSGFKAPSLQDGEWKCGTCDLKNPKDATKCTVCDAPKPASKPADQQSVPNLWAQSGFKAPSLQDGEWKCGTCDLKNPKDATKCTVCDAPKPASKPADQQSVPNLWAQSGFKAPSLQDGEWKCGTCDLKNPKDATKCTVCDAPKPASKPADQQSVPNLWAQSGFKAPSLQDGEWKCGTCDLKNPKDATKCTVCDAPKPASKPADQQSVPNLWAQSGFKAPSLQDGEWKCGTCDLKNPKDATKCTVCDAPKPASKPADQQSVPNLWAQSGFKAPSLQDGEWKCGTCDLKNPKDATKCTVCDAPKPASKPADQQSVPNLWAQSGFKAPSLQDGEWKCGTCDLKNPKDATKCTVCGSPK